MQPNPPQLSHSTNEAASVELTLVNLCVGTTGFAIFTCQDPDFKEPFIVSLVNMQRETSCLKTELAFCENTCNSGIVACYFFDLFDCCSNVS